MLKVALTIGWFLALVIVLFVTAVAMIYWLTENIRGRAFDGPEPSPVDKTTVPYMAMTSLAIAAVRWARSQPLDLVETAFFGLVMGFSVSAATYLVARRKPGAYRGARLWGASFVALCFGGLTGLVSD